MQKFAANQLSEVEVDLIDLNDFEMPIYSIDREKVDGIHPLALEFKERIAQADGIIISFAEHNGAYSAAYKNVYDWVSRIHQKVWMDKPMLLLATSPGGRGAKGVLELASASYRRQNTNTVESFSLPSFQINFDGSQITDEELASEFTRTLDLFEQALHVTLKA